jgi:hypothetical protein
MIIKFYALDSKEFANLSLYNSEGIKPRNQSAVPILSWGNLVIEYRSYFIGCVKFKFHDKSYRK